MTTRNRKVTFRLNDAEFAHLRSLVHKTGWSQESYLRALVAGIAPAEKPPPDYLAMVHELHAIGVNLNQVARKAHVLGVIDTQRYDEECRKLADVIVRITNEVKTPRRL